MTPAPDSDGQDHYDDSVPAGDYPSSVSDADITRSFSDGDPDSLRQMYQRWGPLVSGLAHRAVGSSDAEDIVQQVFVAAWRSRETYHPDRGALGGWLTGITRNTIANHLRRRERTPEVITDPTDLPSHGASGVVTGWTDALMTAMTVQEELERVGEPQQTILRLAYFHQLTHQDIADRLELPVGTVKSHVSRTLRRLREQMGRAGELDARRA